MKKIGQFFKDVSKELKKVRWSNKKEMVTYTVATLGFVLVFGTFFVLTDLVLAGLKMLVA